MRTILFRGKEFSGVLNHAWVVGSLDMNEKEIPSIRFLDSFENKCAIFINPSTVGEYTGFTDPYGRKIFEGDILKITTPDCEYITKVYSEKMHYALMLEIKKRFALQSALPLIFGMMNASILRLLVISMITLNCWRYRNERR